MASKEAVGAASYMLALLQLGAAIAIAIVVRQALWHYTGGWHWTPSWWARVSADNVCLMSPGSVNLCAFTYVVIAFSMAASITLFITQCFPRHAAHCCAALELWLAAFLTALWAAAAATATIYGLRADGASPRLPQHDARTAVWAMAWSEAGLWGLSAVLAAYARHQLHRRSSDLELSASMAGGSHYQRYNDTPFADRSSKWREMRSAYMAHSGASESKAKQLEP